MILGTIGEFEQLLQDAGIDCVKYWDLPDEQRKLVVSGYAECIVYSASTVINHAAYLTIKQRKLNTFVERLQKCDLYDLIRI